MMNSGGSMEAAAVMLMTVFIRSCAVLEPGSGSPSAAARWWYWIQAARAGTPFSFSSTVFLPKMPAPDLGEEDSPGSPSTSAGSRTWR